MTNHGRLTPKLRFPEFRKGPEWELVPLRKLLARSPEYGLNAAAVPYSATLPTYLRITDIDDNGVFISKNKVSVAVDVNDDNYLVDGDLVVARTGASVGKSYRYREEDGKLVYAGFLIRIRPDKTILVPTLLANYLTTKTYWDWVKLTSARSGQPGVNANEYAALPIPIPPSSLADLGIPEQQKIADCLSSLDELIAAEGRKLESLRAYKKGLMQQLFPRAGESVPQRRFPEFRDAAEWETRPLSVIGTNLDNRRIPIAEVSRIKGEIPYYGASGIVDYVKDYIFDEDLLCVSEDGANLVARTYPIAFSISGKTWVNNHAHVLRFDDSHTQKLVEEYLNSIDLRDFITGMAQPKLNRAMLDTIPIPLPVEDGERQQVAGCLSSLDDQITAQAERLSALQAHKKGLMQQLFP